MSLSEIIEYDKDGEALRHPRFRRLFLTILIILVAALAFGIGRLSVSQDRAGVSLEYEPDLLASPAKAGKDSSQSASALNALPKTAGAGEVVASKNGEKYHFGHCAGAKQIKEENKVVFTSPAAAEAAGYTLATNCKPK